MLIAEVALPAIDDLLCALAIDNALLVSEVASGQPGTATETLALVSQAKAVFSVATLVCRSYGLAADCAALWSGLARTFGEMINLWQDVAPDEETVCWLRRELCRLHELASDRAELYTITETERLEFARARETGQQPPLPEPAAQPFSALEMAAIDRRLKAPA